MVAEFMIRLMRLNETDIIVNENFIQTVEEIPDTVITMQNGHRFSVKQSLHEVMEAVCKFGDGKSVLILLTRLNGTEAVVNLDFIEIAEEVPDTVITLKNTHRVTVKESIGEIMEKAENFRNGNF